MLSVVRPQSHFLLIKQILDPTQGYLTNQGIGGGDHRYVKPQITASSFIGLNAMSGSFDVRDLPPPKAGMLVFVNNKWKPDAESG